MGGTAAEWVIAEPQPSPVEGCTAEFITGFFPVCMPDTGRYDIIVHTHVIEHMESIKGFLDDVKGHLRKDGKMIFSLPDMQPMLRKKMTSIINFEHSFLITETYLDLFLKESGFRIDSKLHYGDGHSLIYETTYTDREEKIAVCDLYASNRKGLLEYIRYHEELVRNWNEKMERETRKIYLFGGHITTQYFVGYGLNIARIESILDNDTQKIGKRVGGIDKRIQSPKVLAGEDEAVVIIPNSPYATEIEEDIVKNINPEVEFWT